MRPYLQENKARQTDTVNIVWVIPPLCRWDKTNKMRGVLRIPHKQMISRATLVHNISAETKNQDPRTRDRVHASCLCMRVFFHAYACKLKEKTHLQAAQLLPPGTSGGQQGPPQDLIVFVDSRDRKEFKFVSVVSKRGAGDEIIFIVIQRVV